jgi:hypothetical protein
MDAWEGWPYARAYLLLVALAFLVVGGQVYLLHLRAAFRAKSMYGPVLMAPVIIAAGVVGAITRQGAVGWVVFAVFAIGFAEGAFGTVLHVRGIAARVGGFTLRNLTTGPPPLLPLAFGALGLTGALAVAWEAW